MHLKQQKRQLKLEQQQPHHLSSTIPAKKTLLTIKNSSGQPFIIGRSMVGRTEEWKQLNESVAKGLNVCILGDIGVGKSLLLDNLVSEKKILTLDNTANLKKSLANLLLYLYDNEKDALKNCLFKNFDHDAIHVKLNRESIPNLCQEIIHMVDQKQYILKISELDSLSPTVIRAITTLRDHFIIVTSSRKVPIDKADALWNFVAIHLGNLGRDLSFELIQQASDLMLVEDFKAYRSHIFEQTSGNPRAILEMVDQYRKEPCVSRETIRCISHSGALKEFDMSFVVVFFIASIAGMRYLTGELDNPSLRFIGGCAMILLILSRTIFARTKRKFL